ncbi:hypothetical protein MMC34_000794 [Xylographa carneopallida]|nr:hypothetical protein [Xylographa carneopallida]
MAEGLLAMANRTVPSGAHAQGAVALVKHRGRDNFKSDISQRLFIAVQTQMVGHAVQHSIPVEKLSEHFADDIKALPSNAATRLTALEVEVANLLAAAKVAFESDQRILQSQFLELSSSASDLNVKLFHWADSVPQQWHPLPAEDNSPAALVKFQAHGSRMDIYPEDHTEVGQRLVDDICASVPYCLGSRMKHEAGSEIDYPFAPGSFITNDHRKAAKALGGWYVLGSLNACLGMKTIGEGQLRWIRSQLSRVKGFYNLGHALSTDNQNLSAGHTNILPLSGRSHCLTRISQPDAQLMVPPLGVHSGSYQRKRKNSLISPR